MKNDLINRVARYQYLGYFNGTQTARIPLASVDPLRTLAATYANQVVGNLASAGTTVVYPANVTPPSFNERIATVTFSLVSGKIDVGDVNAIPGGGFVYVNGMIINTGPSLSGLIKSVGGAGKVEIANPTTYPMSVGSIRTSPPGVSTVPTSVVDIIDNNRPIESRQTVYTYTPGIGIRTYVGMGSVNYKDILATVAPVATTPGTLVTYTPMPGQRWQWVMEAGVTRVPPQPQTTPTYSSDVGRLPARRWHRRAGHPQLDVEDQRRERPDTLEPLRLQAARGRVEQQSVRCRDHRAAQPDHRADRHERLHAVDRRLVRLHRDIQVRHVLRVHRGQCSR